MKRVVVAGAGISGLAAAYRIRQGMDEAGVKGRVLVLESSPHPCGKIMTESVAGYLVESGPNGFLDNEPATFRLVSDLGMEDRLLPSSEAGQKRYLLHEGRLVALPSSPPAFLATPLLSSTGKLRALYERLVPKGRGNDESVRDFVTRRLGREVADVLIDAMVSGIYAGDSSRLSIKAAFPRIYELEQEYGGLFKALPRVAEQRKAQGEQTGPTGQPRGRLTSFVSGMQELPARLAHEMAESIRTGTAVLSLRPEGGCIAVLTGKVCKANPRAFGSRTLVAEKDWIKADAVVLAIPAYRAGLVLSKAVPEASEALSGIAYAGVAVVGLGFHRNQVEHPLDGFGFLAPSREMCHVLGARFSSSTFQNRAPRGSVLIEAMAGGVKRPDILELGAADLTRLSVESLKKPLGIRGKPNMEVVFVHKRAVPQYELGHLERVERAEQACSNVPGLWLAGNALRGVAMNKCIAESERIAEQVVEYLA